MRLELDPGDDDAYLELRDALLDELHAWLPASESERDEVVADVAFFLDWRYRESTGVLDEFSPGELAEFLVDWCPRRLTGSTDAAVGLCYAVGVYVDFLAATERLVGGVERAARLRRMVDDLAPTVLAETRAARDDTADDFGSGPVGEPDPYELPFIYIPPPLAEVQTAAAGAPLLTKLEALRGYLGPDGKQLTDKGNLKLADGRALVELLDTGDEMDPQIGDKTWRTPSTANLLQLNFVLDMAKHAGAVRVHQRRLVAVKAWAARSTVERAAALFASIVELGPLESLYTGRIWYLDELHQVLDDGIVHWLAPMLAPDTAELPFESFLKWAQSVVARQVAPHVPERAEHLDDVTHRFMGRIFQVLEEAGVVRWTDRVELPQNYGRSHWTGGTVTLTALGRHLLPDYLDDAGYVLRRADGIADGDGAALIDAMLSMAETQHEALVAAWQADRPVLERVRMLTEAIAEASSAARRMMGFVALDAFDIEVVEPLVRQLLDTPVAGHAALWLMSGGRGDAETLGSFVDVAVFVDVLAGTVDEPDELCRLFAGMSEPLQLLENMWRHPAPETAPVLDALGRHLPDRTLAKAARKAAVRHRSWIANRR